MSPFWPAGRPIKVTALDGRPQEFRWGLRSHRIQHIGDHWRVHIGWWDGEVWRDYWQVTTHTGLLCVIYRDLNALATKQRAEDAWHLERIYE